MTDLERRVLHSSLYKAGADSPPIITSNLTLHNKAASHLSAGHTKCVGLQNTQRFTFVSHCVSSVARCHNGCLSRLFTLSFYDEAY
ncbi:hypothetical protein NQZ68_003914 [Dissostichus eleginoides]|nr:hypothetical protein NQZ68_003914 [Dissostichus eleginoides]